VPYVTPTRNPEHKSALAYAQSITTGDYLAAGINIEGLSVK
jgi:hypothetical protein